MFEVLAISFAEGAEIAVAVGTGALAIATFVMARAARDQAIATRRLAEIAERQLEVERRHVEATTLPVLAVARTGRGNEGLVWIDQDGELGITLENRGAAPATLERATVNLPRGGGVEGSPRGADTIDAGGGQLTVDFPLASEQVERATSGDEVLFQIVYTAPGAERKKALRARVKAKDRGDRWLVLGEPMKDV